VIWFLLVLFLVASFIAGCLHGELTKERRKHEECHERTIEVIRRAVGRPEPDALEAAADAWDSIEEQGNLRRLQSEYTPGGPSMPAIWLRHRAADLRSRIEEGA
jgi:hypothetical protein